ncbi:MAG: MerR family transcriptional regulator [Myxococcales bacterium]|nr:MerR family transcriptional regulator [Myxococcales bacterium]
MGEAKASAARPPVASSTRPSKPGRNAGRSVDGPLAEADLIDIEQRFAAGLTAVQIIDVFAERGLRFSEATFRKYVQQGLLPRSRRVGRKGKHRGSLGVYPAKTVRRINAVKQLMSDGLTIEEIGAKFAQSTDSLEALQEAVDGVVESLTAQVAAVGGGAGRDLKRQLLSVQELSTQLVSGVEALTARLGAQGQKTTLRRTGVFGSEELL